MSESRTIVLAADDRQFDVVFEMLGETLVVPPWQEVRLIVRGPESAQLKIGHGASGVSIFRDEQLEVEIYDQDGTRIEIPASEAVAGDCTLCDFISGKITLPGAVDTGGRGGWLRECRAVDRDGGWAGAVLAVVRV